MPHVQDIGTKWYTHRMSYPTTSFPIIERGATQEIEYPFRTGNALVMRVPFTTMAMVVGRWGDVRNEEEALSSAIGARPYVV